MNLEDMIQMIFTQERELSKAKSPQPKKVKQNAGIIKETPIKADKEDVSEELSSDKYSEDIKAIEAVYGPLSNYEQIEITLQQILLFCPRNRKRTDAYDGLVTEIKNRYGCELIIKSRKKK